MAILGANSQCKQEGFSDVKLSSPSLDILPPSFPQLSGSSVTLPDFPLGNSSMKFVCSNQEFKMRLINKGNFLKFILDLKFQKAMWGYTAICLDKGFVVVVVVVLRGNF